MLFDTVETYNQNFVYVVNFLEWKRIAKAMDFGALIVRNRKLKGKKNRLGKCKKLSNQEKIWLSDLYLLPFTPVNFVNNFYGFEFLYPDANAETPASDDWFALKCTYGGGYVWRNKASSRLDFSTFSIPYPKTIGDFLYSMHYCEYPLMWNIDVVRYYFKFLIPSELIRNPETKVRIGSPPILLSKPTSTDLKGSEDCTIEDFDDDEVDDYTEEDLIRLNGLAGNQ